MVARSPLRRRLAAQVRSSRQSVLLIERQLVDEGGLSIASTLEGWWLSNLPGRRRRPPSSPYPPHAHILLWTDEQLAVRDRFWTTTRARAVRIAAATGRMRVELFQPGLFDRRLDRLRQVRHEEQEALAAATQLRARRYDALHSATTLTSGRWLLIEP